MSAQRQDFKSAMEHYSRALALRPDHVYAQIGMGEALIQMNEAQKALEHLLAVNRLDPLNPTVHYRLASVYREMGREADARDEFAAFKKLRESKKQIEQIYQQMHQVVPEKEAIPHEQSATQVFDFLLCYLHSPSPTSSKFGLGAASVPQKVEKWMTSRAGNVFATRQSG